LFILLALKVGKVSLAAPIVATEGAAAAVISIFFGEKVVAAVIVGLAVIVIGVVLASTGEKSTSPLEAKARFETVLFAVLGAIIAGSSLYSTGQISADVAPLWRAMAPRVFGVVLIAVPLLVSRKLKLSKKALPLLAIAAVCELGGWISYAVGSTHSVAVAAVVSSQFAAIAAVAAFFVFKERLTRMQTVGVVCVIAGVTVVSLFSH
jgi:drug/metabolite transporter (DMT)-like permease